MGRRIAMATPGENVRDIVLAAGAAWFALDYLTLFLRFIHDGPIGIDPSSWYDMGWESETECRADVERGWWDTDDGKVTLLEMLMNRDDDCAMTAHHMMLSTSVSQESVDDVLGDVGVWEVAR